MLVEIRDDRDASANVRAAGEDVRAGHDRDARRHDARRGADRRAVVGRVRATARASPPARRHPRDGRRARCRSSEFDDVRRGPPHRLVEQLLARGRGARRRRRAGIARHRRRRSRRRWRSMLRGAEGCDVVVTSGGVSVGDFDYTRDVVERLGGTLSLWRVRMRPGAPLAFGRCSACRGSDSPAIPCRRSSRSSCSGGRCIRTLARLDASRIVARCRSCSTRTSCSRAPLTHFLRVRARGWRRRPAPRAPHRRAELGNAHVDVVGRRAARRPARSAAAAPAGTRLRALPLDGDLGGSASFLG